MLIGVGVSIPVIVVDAVTGLEGRWAVSDGKLNGFGMVSIVVAVKVPTTPPMVSETTTLVAGVEALVVATAIVWPAKMVPGALVNAKPLIEYVPPTMVTGAGAVFPEMVIVFDVTGLPRGCCATLVK